MAYIDYRLCDNCGKKAFYDADLNYQFEQGERTLKCGEVKEHHHLENCGDWAVLCKECAKTHKTVIVER